MPPVATTSDSGPAQSRSYFYAGVFLASATLMAMQIIHTRLFSVTTWYHLAFLVISIAMFGLTLGALQVHRGNAEQQKRDCIALIERNCIRLGVSLGMALVVQLFVPIVANELILTLTCLPLVSIVTVVPYYYAGSVITLCLTRAPFPIGRTYGLDLLGAAAGCLFALGLIETMDGVSAIGVVCFLALAAAMMFARCQGRAFSGMRWPSGLVFGGLLLVIAANLGYDRPLISVVFSKGSYLPRSGVAYEKWNTISRVTVSKETNDASPFMWGPSPKLPADMKASFRVLQIDGDAGTPFTKFNGRNFESMDWLKYDVTNIAYSLPAIDSAAIIGVGGGRDALSARMFGVKNISAIDINPIQVSLLTHNKWMENYTSVSRLPNISIQKGEAQNWFSRSKQHFDLIEMSMIDTWAATGAGAFSLSENSVYTTDAWRIFLNHLNPHGVLTVSRWYTAEDYYEPARLISIAMSVLFERGEKSPADHIFMARSGKVATMVFARDPLTTEQLRSLHSMADRYRYEVLVSPEARPSNQVMQEILSQKDQASLTAYGDSAEVNLSAPTSVRPFFFNMVRLTDIGSIVRLAAKDTKGSLVGHARATLNLLVIILFSFLMTGLVIILPLWGSVRSIAPRVAASLSGYFLLIGLGFMFIEVTLLQTMSVYLGHPIYGLGVVLFGIVLSTGFGSLISDRKPLQSTGAKMAWCCTLAAYAVVLSFAIPHLFAVYVAAEFAWRVALCLAMIFPAGLLLGYGFPTGYALAEQLAPTATAWFWGINGAASVMGSAVAVALNIAFGLDRTMIVGGACYCLLLLPLFALSKSKPLQTV